MNTAVRFVKTFSKGQITIPKEFREVLGKGSDFWLKMYLSNGKLVAEPVEQEQKNSKKNYAKKLLTIKGDWFSYKEYKRNRAQIEKQISKRAI